MNIKINLEVKKILKERKRYADNLAEQNLLLARENLEFLNLEKQANTLKIEIAKRELNNFNCEELLKKLEKTQKNKESVLKTLNLTEKDLIPNYFCKKCDDTGICEGLVCECEKKLYSEILLQESGMQDMPTFENAKVESDLEKVLFLKMQTWCNKFPNVNHKSIFLTGETGVGKSFLCAAMAHELINKNFFVYYTTSFMMNQKFLEFCKNSSNSEILQNFIEADVLIIDDLGTEPLLKNITLNYLYLILNERLTSGKATIINSNLMPDEILNRYGERIFSRIMNKKTGLVLCYKGKDRRINN